MCNLYSMTSNQEAIRQFSQYLKIASNAGNLQSTEAVFANGWGPIVRNTAEGRELATCRWGMPSNPENLVGKNYDSGITNVRRHWIDHWSPFLGVESRCVVPWTSFSEPDQANKTNIFHWFALSNERPLAFFAGVWTPQWTSCRKVKDGVTCDDLYAFFTTGPNAEVKAIHPKAMPVILRTPEEVEAWMTQPWDVVKKTLIKSLPDGSLQIVGRGRKKDGPGMPIDSAPRPEPELVAEIPPQAELF